jgi:release factor glutamine methyltransferase
MPSVTKRVYFSDLKFDVCEEVYEPAEDSFLFAKNLSVNAGERVLDVGTGTGVLGIVAAEKAGEVLAVDVNPYAVRCAKWNASLNNVRERMAFARADLFDALRETTQFDVVLFNAPYLPSEASEMNTWLGRAWAGGVNGRQVIDRFIVEAPTHLSRKGRVFLMQSTLAGVEETQQRFAERGMVAQVVAEQRLPFFEVLTLLKAVFRT